MKTNNMKLIKPIVFFDLETTGIDVNKDRIVEFAAIKKNVDSSTDKLHFYIHPMIPVPIEASNIHGLTDDFLKDKPSFMEVAEEIYEWLKGSDLGGYNSNGFDIPLLLSEFRRSNIDFNTDNIKFIDVLEIERTLSPRTLSGVYKHYMGKVLEGSHSALVDVEATLEIFEAQCENFDLEADIVKINEILLEKTGRVDLSGKLCIIDEKTCWTFGKNKGKPILDDKGYIKWFLTTSPPEDTRKIIVKEMNKGI